MHGKQREFTGIFISANRNDQSIKMKQLEELWYDPTNPAKLIDIAKVVSLIKPKNLL